MDAFPFFNTQYSTFNHSKEASARVYAYQGSSSIESTLNNIKNSLFVEHSYTL